MLEKRAIKVSLQKNQLSQNQFLSNLFVLKKNGWGYQRVINLKTLNQFVPYMHFKMESLQTLKYMMKERDYMCKIDLIDAYFTVPLDKSSFSKVFMGKGTSKNSCLCVLALDQPLEFLSSFYLSTKF